MTAIATQLANDLLSIGAVFLRPDQPFTWASGILSPIYTDNRLVLAHPIIRQRVAEGFSQAIREGAPNCEVVLGTATAGIPHATLAAHLMGLPTGYVRGGAKDHGRENRIEGGSVTGKKVVLIEDLISTGGSVLEAAEALTEADAQVMAVFAIFTYGMKKGIDRFQKAGLPLYTLTNFDTLVDVAVARGDIKPEDKVRLLAFRDNPQDDSWRNA